MTISIPRIELLLAEKGLTQAELSFISGVSRQGLCGIMQRGTCEPRTAGKLAAGLGVPVKDIIEQKGA